MLAKFPDLRKPDEGGIVELIYTRMGKERNCEEVCAAASVTKIAAVEVVWVGAMFGCATTVAGYPLCAGVAMAVKMLSLTAIGLDLTSCLGGCRDDPIATRMNSHMRGR